MDSRTPSKAARTYLLTKGAFLGTRCVTAVRHRGTTVATGSLAEAPSDGGRTFEFVATASEATSTHDKLSIATRRLLGCPGVARLREYAVSWRVRDR